MDIKNRLAELRRLMRQHQIDAVIIPSTDPHQSEYVADHWQERQWISGFTGSAGTVAVTQQHAGLWTDSRYFLQAEMELKGSGITLHKMLNQFTTPYIDYLVENLPSGSTVGINGWMFSQSATEHLEKALTPSRIQLNKRVDLITALWQDRPGFPDAQAFEHEVRFAGKSVQQKLDEIRSKMADQHADYHYLSALDDIAWTFNLRGSDVECNPLVIAYAIVGKTQSWLFVDGKKLPDTYRQMLKDIHVEVLPYHEILSFVNNLDQHAAILVDKHQCSAAVYEGINAAIIDRESVPKLLKAIKNETEIAHVRHAMIKDGAALANAFYWLDQNIQSQTVTECSLAEKIAECRSRQTDYIGESFHAIIGYKSNGAIIHYHPHPDTCSTILPEGILLADSGGQYQDGTTDITRTFALSPPDPEVRKHYTLVLKGLISLSMAKFPEGTTGVQLDSLARQFLWAHGLNYLHGTGHGVGFALNVHEPPQGFAANFSDRGKSVQLPGMLTSNEPGYYIDGRYGIRIENLILCKTGSIPGFLEFETVTLYPFDLGLTDAALLTPAEKDWINRYHDMVYEKVSPMLDEVVSQWFRDKCGSVE